MCVGEHENGEERVRLWHLRGAVLRKEVLGQCPFRNRSNSVHMPLGCRLQTERERTFNVMHAHLLSERAQVEVIEGEFGRPRRPLPHLEFSIRRVHSELSHAMPHGRCLGVCREDGLTAYHIAHTKQEDAVQLTPRLVRDSDEQRAVHGWLFTRGDEHRGGRFSRQPVPAGDYTDARRGGGEVEVLQYMGLEHSVQKGSDLYAAMILLPTNTRRFSVW